MSSPTTLDSESIKLKHVNVVFLYRTLFLGHNYIQVPENSKKSIIQPIWKICVNNFFYFVRIYLKILKYFINPDPVKSCIRHLLDIRPDFLIWCSFSWYPAWSGSGEKTWSGKTLIKPWIWPLQPPKNHLNFLNQPIHVWLFYIFSSNFRF